MKLDKIRKFKNQLIIPGFQPRDLRNLVWKCSQEPETRWKHTNKLQCQSFRHRSLTDIYNICLSYYPEVTLDEVMYHLARLCYKGYCISNYCPVIQKQVFYPNSIYDAEFDGNIVEDDYYSNRDKEDVNRLREIQKEHAAEWSQEKKKKKVKQPY